MFREHLTLWILVKFSFCKNGCVKMADLHFVSWTVRENAAGDCHMNSH